MACAISPDLLVFLTVIAAKSCIFGWKIGGQNIKLCRHWRWQEAGA